MYLKCNSQFDVNQLNLNVSTKYALQLVGPPCYPVHCVLYKALTVKLDSASARTPRGKPLPTYSSCSMSARTSSLPRRMLRDLPRKLIVLPRPLLVLLPQGQVGQIRLEMFANLIVIRKIIHSLKMHSGCPIFS